MDVPGTNMEKQSSKLGLGWTVTALAAVTGGVGVLLSLFLKKSLGVVLIVGAVVWGLNTFRQDIFDLLNTIQENNQASEIRQLELERERMQIEAEDRERQRRHQAAQEARRERAEERRAKETLNALDLAILKAERQK